MPNWDVNEAIEALLQLRAQHLMQVQRIDEGIRVLQAVDAGESTMRHPSQDPRALAEKAVRSVYEVVLTLANEANRDWSVPDLIAEIERRGIAVEVNDLQNSLHSAVARATDQGELLRVGRGRYRSTRWPEYVTRGPGNVFAGEEFDGSLDSLFKGEGEPLE